MQNAVQDIENQWSLASVNHRPDFQVFMKYTMTRLEEGRYSGG